MLAAKNLSFITLLMLISFASVNAVLFTPALPSIANFFSITAAATEQTITWFLIGYTIGQLIYGPLANRYGRKPTLYLGIGLQIISCCICILSELSHQFLLLVIGRFLLALGSGVGLKMTFTLVNECYEAKIASQKISYLILSFAITPALAVALGGFLNIHFGWVSCFYLSALYGAVLLFLVMRLPETLTKVDLDALKIKHLFDAYLIQFKNSILVISGLLMGLATAFIYVFAALAPFIAINLLGMNSAEYGVKNLLPALGLIIGSLLSAQLTKKLSLQAIIKLGVMITACSVLLMFYTTIMKLSALYSLFLPMMCIYFGLALIIANVSSVSMCDIKDKAHASAVMNFINMGLATAVVLTVGLFHAHIILLPLVFIFLCIGMIAVYIIL